MPESPGLFLADAEENDLLEWTSTTSSDGNTLAASVASALHGTYGFDFQWVGVGSDNYAYKNFGVYHDIFSRCYVRFDAVTSAEGVLVAHSYGRLSGEDKASLQFYGRGAGNPLGGLFKLDGITVWNFYTSAIFNQDQTYCVEWRYKDETGGAGTGGGQFWIDGASQYSDFTKSNGTAGIDRLFVGNNSAGVPANGDRLFFDDVKIDTSYIGTYTEAAGAAEKLRVLTSARWR